MMSRTNIRLRYTGLITFASRIVSILTGAIFTVAVTRNITATEFGVWKYLSLLTSYVIFPMRGVNYWAVRDVARGRRNAATTCFIFNFAVSLVGMVLFVALSEQGAAFLSTSALYFLISGITVLALTSVGSLETVARGSMPHVLAYGFLAFEVTKVVLGLVSLFLLGSGFLGALISVFLAYLVQTFVLAFLLRGELTRSFDSSIGLRWVKMIWLPILNTLAGVLYSLDLTIIAVLSPTTAPIALIGAAQAITGTISHSSVMASALYPKLLSESVGERDIETSLRLVLMVSLPMTVGAIMLATPLLRVLQHGYSIASPVLVVLAVSTLISSFQSIINSIIIGSGKVDLDEDVSFREILKSRLFFPAKVSYIVTTLHLIATFLVTSHLVNTNATPSNLLIALATSLVGLFTILLSFVYKWAYAKKIYPFTFPRNSFVKQIVATAIMGGVLYLFYPRRFIETLLAVLYGFLTYAAVLLVLDTEARSLLQAVVKELTSKLDSSREV